MKASRRAVLLGGTLHHAGAAHVVGMSRNHKAFRHVMNAFLTIPAAAA